MKKFLIFLSLAVTLGAVQAVADTVTLTFTGLQNEEEILNYYNGGAGSSGSTFSGPNYGITFSPNSLAIISGLAGGSGNFSNVPAPATNTIAFFLSGTGDVMDVASGFSTGFSFYYAAANTPGSISVYSGLDGTGTLLDTIDLPVNGSGCDSTGEAYDCWTNTGVAFAGTAESVIFGGAANYIGFADVTLGASSVPSAVPEPNSVVLLGSGLLGLLGIARSKFRA